MEILFKAKCNCLFRYDHMSVEALGPKPLAGIVAKNVERFGNWVGGTVQVTEEVVLFSMNAMNAMFQVSDDDLVIPVAQINAARLGKMMIIAKTADVDVNGALVRFRLMGKHNDRLVETLSGMIAARS